MRLSRKEVLAITSAFTKLFPESEFELYLFGSRTDDTKKGGDIDLLVVVSDLEKSQFADAKSQLKNEMFKSMDEQRIDITVASPQDLEQDTFLRSVQGQLVKLT
jgi:hypothetical protein